ncbi:MAG: hypothetical protein AB7G88_07840, partial [Thermomicrobiales bacterium]
TALGFAMLADFLTGITGPLTAMILLLLTSMSINTAEIISGVIYCIAYPVAIMAATLFYLYRRENRPGLATSPASMIAGADGEGSLTGASAPGAV